MNILLVGHRGTGKTVVGAAVAAELGWHHVDVDAQIEVECEMTCAALVAFDEAEFRETELATLRDILDGDEQIVSAGAGLSEMPSDTVILWLQRDGWEDTALAERERLRPEWEWPDELEWMCTTREPRWLAAAHLHVHVPYGRSVARVAREIATYVKWLQEPSDLARKTWVVPTSPAELSRACQDARLFGLAGVEVRSDIFSDFPATEAPTLASIRTPDTTWVDAALETADAFDVDLDHFETFLSSGALGGRVRPLILSSHPTTVDPDDVTALVAAARRIQTQYPAWAADLSIKYAPHVQGVPDIGVGRALLAPLRRANIGLTYLPQGGANAWIRPLLGPLNATNYVSAKLRGERAGVGSSAQTPWDFQDWLPHLTGPRITTWDALIGDPVHRSQGDVWHRRAAIEANEPCGYVKVPAPTEEFGSILALLAELGVRGVSVTSPLKSRVAFICPDDATFGELLDEDARWAAAKAEAPLRTGNTLRRDGERWLATDTDEAGMAASLHWFEQSGIGPATVALFGSGGVAPAIVRAIDASDWFLVFRCRARDGWPADKPPFVTIVVDAGGPNTTSREGAPRSRGWLDLHYNDVAAAPSDAVHLAGDVFFDAQAEAQRNFWRGE